MKSQNFHRFLELDVFRGIAALGVVLFHYTSQYSTLFQHSPEMNLYFSLGRHGVELFFIMSGFVILITLERTKSSLDFIVKRFARLYPAYWVAIALTFTVVMIAKLPGEQVSFWQALVNLTMIQGFFNVPHVDPVYWTLQVELCFYVIMLLVYKLGLLKRVELVMTGWLFLALFYSLKTYLAPWGVGELLFPFGEDISSFLNDPNLQASLMPMGITTVTSPLQNLRDFLRELLIIKYAHLFVAGLMLYQGKKYGFSRYRWGIIVLCILAQRVAYSWENSWSTTLYVAVFIGLLYLAIKGHLTFINLKPLVFLGSISYSIYLIHQNLGYIIIRQLYEYNVHPYLSILVAVICSIFLARLITVKVEQPANQWIRQKYKEYQKETVQQL